MTTSEIRKKYLAFFKAKQHAVIASASLVPENDPTTLFTGSGMQPLLPFLLGGKHPMGTRLVDSQKCFRAEDIDEVGDNRHTTFFEMLGNWSLGDYFKKEQLPWFFEFLTEELALDPTRIYVTVFSGDEANGVPKDTESAEIWQKLFKEKGIEAKTNDPITVARAAEVGMQDARIFYYDATKNWWSRSGVPQKMPAGEPGGPDSEVFYEFAHIAHDDSFGKYCHPNCDCGRFMEIGNSVFMAYQRQATGSFTPLDQKNVDFGGGLERLAAAVEGSGDVFRIDSLYGIVEAMGELVGKKYDESSEEEKRAFRVIADHSRAAVFLVSDDVEPSNMDRGYVVRRFIRRAVRFGNKLGVAEPFLAKLVEGIVGNYKAQYPRLGEKQAYIATVLTEEEEKFNRTLARGLKEFEQFVAKDGQQISGEDAFILFTTYGFPVEMTIELASERSMTVDTDLFRKKFKEHQDKSRAGVTQKFHGGLADRSWETTKGHTATHLLQATLRKVLGDHVFQKGSNITPERLRFDFSHPEKLTPEELKAVEDGVNKAIKADYQVSWKEMSFDEAKAIGALGLFEERYGEKVKVYSMGDYSHEVCGGPHVEHTAQVGSFKIKKQEAVSRGVRRIKAIAE